LSGASLFRLLRFEDAEQFGLIDRKAPLVGPLRRKHAFLDGEPEVDFAPSGLFRRFLKAQIRHRHSSRETLLGRRWGNMVNEGLSCALRCAELGIERVTLYRYVGPNGELRNYGKRVPGSAEDSAPSRKRRQAADGVATTMQPELRSEITCPHWGSLDDLFKTAR
jgi:hypothetical protein